MKQSILIKCPICQAQKSIEIPINLIEKVTSLAAISMPTNTICEHSFQAFVDKNFQVRGYQKIDFELPNNIQEQKIELDVLLDSDLSDAETIKWNLSIETLAYIIRSVMFNENFVFVIPDSKKQLKEPLEHFIYLLFEKSFKPNFTIITDSNYKKIKGDLKNKLVIGWKKILQNKSKLLNIKNMEIENKIVDDFYNKFSKQEAIINLEFEIRKLFTICNYVIELTKKGTSEEIQDIFGLSFSIVQKYSTVVDIQYLEYVIEIVRHYFKIVLPFQEPEKVSWFLDLL